MKFKILVVDDEKNIREGLASALQMDGYDTLTSDNGINAWDLFNREDVDLVISDLKMPGMSGEELLKKITGSNPGLPVIILTGHGSIESAVDAMREGAYDFLTKPVNLDRLSLLTKRALAGRELYLQHRAMQEELEQNRKKIKYSKIIGQSSSMKKIMDVIEQVAPTKASVLITGESGVGKELIADAIHNFSNRASNPFIKVHCAALTESLLESELFGHEKGAFTGAVAQKSGRFELAHTGSVFLDEIGEINQNVQVKILRVLQEKKFERVGGEKTVEVDVRLIAATNRDLKTEIAESRFREDLYYRLNVVNIHIPPLRERKEDIPLLATAFIHEFARDNGKQIDGIDPKARLALHNYPWPGNIRELRNCLESAVVLTKNTVIMVDDLPPHIHEKNDDHFIRVPIGSSMAEAERLIIESTLAVEKGNKSRTAEILGIGRKTLHRKLDEYEANESQPADAD